MTEPTLEQLAEVATAPEWSRWGEIWDRQALVAIITELQAQDFTVRCSPNGNHWRLWYQRKASA